MPREIKHLPALVALLLVVGSAGPAHADLPEPPPPTHKYAPAVEPRPGALSSVVAGVPSPPVVGPDIPIYEDDNEQRRPAVAYNSRHDEYLVVWYNRWEGGGTNIYARRLSGQGDVLSWFAVAYGPNNRFDPAVAYDPDHDRYLVVWMYDRDGDSPTYNIYGRFIPWYGPDASLSEFPISTSTSDQYSPEVAYNEHADWPEFLVVWQDATDDVPYNISGRRVYADGTGFPPGDGFTIASHPSASFFSPDVAYNLARNEYLVVFGDDLQDIYATRLEANGNVLGGGQFGVATWPDHEHSSSVAACYTADQYFVAWESLGSHHYDIYGRFVNGDGTVADVLHVSDSSVFEDEPDVACNPRARHYLIVWQQVKMFGDGVVWGRLVHADKTQDAQFGIVPPSSDYDCLSPVVAAGFPGYLVAWDHSYLNQSDIHGRLVWPAVVYLPLTLRSPMP